MNSVHTGDLDGDFHGTGAYVTGDSIHIGVAQGVFCL